MPLYCYMIIFYDWEDSEFCPVFHDKKFTKEEFDKLCKEAYEQLKHEDSLALGHYYAYAIEIANYLVENYGFKLLNEKLIVFNTNDVKTGTRRDDEEGNWF